ncbi:MAG TPA: IS1595 family transposase [Terriglobales bacterium]
MNGKDKQPKTLQEAIWHFGNPDNALAYMVRLRWPDGVVTCPACGRTDVVFLKNQRKWQCKSVHPKRQFSAKVGTIFEDSPIPLEKWVVAVWMLSNCKNGVSSYEVAKAIGVTQKSAWFMLHRIRVGMKLELADAGKFGGNGGEVEADESFIGGSTRNMHKERKLRIQRLRNEVPDWKATAKNPYQTAVQGILDRDARQIRAKVIPNVKRETLQYEILKQVEFGSKLYTDSAYAYNELASLYAHEVVNHEMEYVKGRVHTNGLENFWSLLKRTLHGTYVAVEPFHLERYVDEQVFRYNNRATKGNKLTDADRFDFAMSGILGKRLTFAELTGKTGETNVC